MKRVKRLYRGKVYKFKSKGVNYTYIGKYLGKGEALGSILNHTLDSDTPMTWTLYLQTYPDTTLASPEEALWIEWIIHKDIHMSFGDFKKQFLDY
jgi:hypothetical protein